jgi:hypothetical protein
MCSVSDRQSTGVTANLVRTRRKSVSIGVAPHQLKKQRTEA